MPIHTFNPAKRRKVRFILSDVRMISATQRLHELHIMACERSH